MIISFNGLALVNDTLNSVPSKLIDCTWLYLRFSVELPHDYLSRPLMNQCLQRRLHDWKLNSIAIKLGLGQGLGQVAGSDYIIPRMRNRWRRKVSKTTKTRYTTWHYICYEMTIQSQLNFWIWSSCVFNRFVTPPLLFCLPNFYSFCELFDVIYFGEVPNSIHD